MNVAVARWKGKDVLGESFQKIIAEDVADILAHPIEWEAFDGTTVWITGAAGFLPAYLIEVLLGRNDRVARHRRTRVVGLVRTMETAGDRFAAHRERGDLELRSWDAGRVLPAEAETWPKPDFIVHAASQASPRHFGRDPIGTLMPNVLGTHQVLEAARKTQAARVLYISSSEVYGQLPSEKIPTKETDFGAIDPATLRACYSEGKRAGETLCVAYSAQHGVRASMARVFHTYGPGLRLDDGRLFADLFRDAHEGRNIILSSDGTARRPYCYVADGIRGLFTVLLRGDAGMPYNVGNDEAEVSVRELAELVAALVPEKRLRVEIASRQVERGYIPSLVSRNCPDTSRLRALGWRPLVDLKTGLARTLQSLQ